VFVACDATDGPASTCYWATWSHDFGRIDILVNNVGGATAFAPIAAMDDQTWEQGLLFNVTSAFYASRKALGSMLAQKSGRIINISLRGGQARQPFIVQYVTAKHALNGFPRVCPKRLGPRGSPSTRCARARRHDLVTEQAEVAAPLAGITTEQFLEQYAAESASKRVNTVEEVAVVAVLLASDAGSGINGAMIPSTAVQRRTGLRPSRENVSRRPPLNAHFDPLAPPRGNHRTAGRPARPLPVHHVF